MNGSSLLPLAIMPESELTIPSYWAPCPWIPRANRVYLYPVCLLYSSSKGLEVSSPRECIRKPLFMTCDLWGRHLSINISGLIGSVSWEASQDFVAKKLIISWASYNFTWSV
jgi:hypothetical protein